MKLMGDGYVDLIERTRREHAEWMAQAHPPAAKMRESSGGLIDLSDAGVPMVDGATFGVPDEVYLEPTNEEILDGLRQAGVPLLPGRMSMRMRVSRRAWHSATLRESALALADKAAQAEEARRKALAAGPLGVELAGDTDEPDDEGDGLLDLSAAGVPSTIERRLTSEERMAEAARDREAVQRMREGEYGGEGGTARVFYQDADTYREICELYTILDQELENGTPNLENAKIEDLAQTVLRGKPLSTVQQGTFLALRQKHAKQLAALRASEDDSQRYVPGEDVEAAAMGRIVTPGEKDAA